MKRGIGLLLFLVVNIKSIKSHGSCSNSIEALSDSLATLSEDFYKEIIRRQDSNLVFSPLSLHSAISLLAEGSTKGSKTFGEFSSLLAKGGLINKFLGPYRDLDCINKNGSLSIGSHIWLAQGKTLNPKFKETIKDISNVEVDKLDFGSSDSVDEVNDWVNKLTNGKIPEIANELNPNSEAIIVNALHFKAKWTFPFLDLDFPDPFNIHENKTVNITMMSKQGYDMKYGTFKLDFTEENLSHEVVAIPYKNSEFEMLIILPHQDVGLHLIEKNLIRNNTGLFKILKKVNYVENEEVFIRMPKFELTTDVKAKEIFQSLGLKSIFTDESELGELTTSKNLKVGNILHKATINVNPDGTEAAAATFLDIVTFSASYPKIVYVDRPFMFVLQNSVHKIPLMVGRVMDPTTTV